MRTGMNVELSPADRAWLEGLIKAPSTPQKHVWRARIVLLTADGLGISAIMRRTAKSKPHGVALAGAVHGGRRGRAVVRQDASVSKAAVGGGGSSAGGRNDAQRDAARRHPLERPRFNFEFSLLPQVTGKRTLSLDLISRTRSTAEAPLANPGVIRRKWRPPLRRPCSSDNGDMRDTSVAARLWPEEDSTRPLPGTDARAREWSSG